MALTFDFADTENLLEGFKKIGYAKAKNIIKYAIYPGAGVVADAVKAEIEANHSKSGALASSLALKKMRVKGDVTYTMLDFDGYDEDGVPNVIKARALESGTKDGRIQATHFVTTTVERVRAEATAAIEKAFEEKFDQIIGK